MFRVLLLVGITASSAANAQSRTSCHLTDDNNNCNRVVACVGNEGTWFNGRAFGRGEGEFSGKMSDGTECNGTWMSQNWMGLGQADVTCENGNKGRVYYTYQDPYTGTAVGRGSMADGTPIRIWSGTHVLEYLRGDTGERIAYLPCAGGDIPIS
ncbi:hypothetical protein BVC71_09915 [Marivivens niveibacter]|uniref:Uncharacterized protein n=1 Tax=Marivivens niveibacter TaxID=1930667 RepID=A0A251WWZ5_9RHOB|nr:hypothetical protein [Marivivens niveibacter]OUD09020.1 hypothetical protein BVC71_09915 [Marivivens niveibacter]